MIKFGFYSFFKNLQCEHSVDNAHEVPVNEKVKTKRQGETVEISHSTLSLTPVTPLWAGRTFSSRFQLILSTCFARCLSNYRYHYFYY